MTPEQLRKACEVAGIELSINQGDLWMVSIYGRWYSKHNLMLPAYVAERLVAMVWKTRHHKSGNVIDIYLDAFDTSSCDDYFATAEQRIAAAMQALGHEWED